MRKHDSSYRLLDELLIDVAYEYKIELLDRSACEFKLVLNQRSTNIVSWWRWEGEVWVLDSARHLAIRGKKWKSVIGLVS